MDSKIKSYGLGKSSVKKDDTLVFDKFHGRDAVKITCHMTICHPKIGAEIWALVRLKNSDSRKVMEKRNA